MAGILDKKSRIIDAVLTVEGRRQLGEGTLSVSYATFTDGEVFYAPSSEYGHEDPTHRLYIEACNLPQDQIIFEANDEGKLNPLRNQTIYVASPGLNTSGSFSSATLKDGRLIATQVFHGRRIKVSDINQNFSDEAKGFIYSDFSGVTGSILINPYLKAGEISVSAPTGGPYSCQVGTKNNLTRTEFAKQICNAINSLSSAGGPSVKSDVSYNTVYLAPAPTVVGDRFNLTYSGTLSSPIVLEEAVVGGRILSEEIEASAFASQIPGILSSSFDNFLDLRLLSTVDRVMLDDSFSLSCNDVKFDISKISTTKIAALRQAPPEINAIDSLFSDDKLSRAENFMYLPPIVKVSDSIVRDKTNIESLKPYLLGDYPSWGDNEKQLDYSGLSKQLADFEVQETDIVNTSINNNIIAQIFEVSNSGVSKLDVIDYGDVNSLSPDDERGDKRRVFFAGKVYVDDRGTSCFVNIFTFMLNKSRREEE